MQKVKATMYWQGSFMPGVSKMEIHLIDVGTRAWAQYQAAPYCTFLPKRARKNRKLQLDGYQPWLVVVEGWNRPDFENWKTPKEGSVSGVVVREMRFSMCDERWGSEADQFVAALQAAGVRMLADYRHTQGFSSYAPDHTTPRPLEVVLRTMKQGESVLADAERVGERHNMDPAAVQLVWDRLVTEGVMVVQVVDGRANYVRT